MQTCVCFKYKTFILPFDPLIIQYPENQRPPEEERDRERDRKVKEERSRMKDNSSKDENKDGIDGSCPPSAEDQRCSGKDSRSNAHIPFGSPLAQHQHQHQHQPYLHYMHGYPFGQGYDPSHPGYRGMSSVMMQNYPGKANY